MSSNGIRLYLLGGLVAAVVMVISPVWADEPAQPKLPVVSRDVSVNEAVEMALANSPTVEMRQAMVAAAQARVGMAKAMTRPQVSGTGFATAATMPMIVPGPEGVEPRAWSIAPDKGRLDATLMAMYPLYTGGKLQAQVKGAKSLQQAAAGEVTASELGAALAAKNAYYQVIMARQLVDVYRKRVEDAGERLRISEKAFEEGRIARYDLLRNQTDLAEAQQQLNTAQGDVEVALADFKSALGVSQSSQVTLTDSLGAPEALEQLTELQETASKSRPEIAAARARVEAAQESIKVAKGSYKPQVYATGMAEAAVSGGSESGVLIGVTASIPIFDAGLRKSGVDEAQAMLRQVQAEQRDVALMIDRDISAAYARVVAVTQNVTLAQAAVAQAEEDYRTIKLRYEAGKAINVEVLDALTALTRARSGYVEALYNYNVARADLLRAVGRR